MKSELSHYSVSNTRQVRRTEGSASYHMVMHRSLFNVTTGCCHTARLIYAKIALQHSEIWALLTSVVSYSGQGAPAAAHLTNASKVSLAEPGADSRPGPGSHPHPTNGSSRT